MSRRDEDCMSEHEARMYVRGWIASVFCAMCVLLGISWSVGHCDGVKEAEETRRAEQKTRQLEEKTKQLQIVERVVEDGKSCSAITIEIER